MNRGQNVKTLLHGLAPILPPLPSFLTSPLSPLLLQLECPILCCFSHTPQVFLPQGFYTYASFFLVLFPGIVTNFRPLQMSFYLWGFPWPLYENTPTSCWSLCFISFHDTAPLYPVHPHWNFKFYGDGARFCLFCLQHLQQCPELYLALSGMNAFPSLLFSIFL